MIAQKAAATRAWPHFEKVPGAAFQPRGLERPQLAEIGPAAWRDRRRRADLHQSGDRAARLRPAAESAFNSLSNMRMSEFSCQTDIASRRHPRDDLFLEQTDTA